jgi:hypothetical protein
MLHFMKRSAGWAQAQLSQWALFDARQVLLIAIAIGGLLLYARMSGG